MELKGKYLITTNEWFFGPDGMQYRAVWGSVKVMEDSILGVKTNRNSTNWYLWVGDENKGMIVAGCQVHYAIKREEVPFTGEINDYTFNDGKYVTFTKQSSIYIAEEY